MPCTGIAYDCRSSLTQVHSSRLLAVMAKTLEGITSTHSSQQPDASADESLAVVCHVLEFYVSSAPGKLHPCCY